jgi:hypothetical protein
MTPNDKHNKMLKLKVNGSMMEMVCRITPHRENIHSLYFLPEVRLFLPVSAHLNFGR